MNSPLISVIIPIYNGMPFILDTIKSIQAQTYTNLEILCIIDGGEDDSFESIISLKDSRIKVLKKSNEGLCKTLNFAIREAKGSIIARIDQDDIAHPQRLEIQLNCIINNRYDCVFSTNKKIGEQIKYNDIKFNLTNFVPLEDYNVDKDGVFAHSSLFGKKEVLEQLLYREEYYPSDDLDLSYRISENFFIGIIRFPLIYYRVHTKANTYKYYKKMQFLMRYSKFNHINRLKELPEISIEKFNEIYNSSTIKVINRRRKDFGRLCYRIAGDKIVNRSYISFFYYFFLSFLINPIYTTRKITKS